MGSRIRAGRFYADPALTEFGGRYYLYPTTDGSADWSSTSFRVLSSSDLREWVDEGQILDLVSDVTWADRFAWAPAAAITITIPGRPVPRRRHGAAAA